MNCLKKLSAILGLGVGVVVLSGIAACDESQDIENWVENTNKLRLAARQQSDKVPYRQEQFNAFKSYFSELNQMALALRNDVQFGARFNAAILQSDLGATCAKVFMSRNEWQLILDRCTRNNFFLCSDEVRAYPEVTTAIREQLGAEQRRRFDDAKACRAAL